MFVRLELSKTILLFSIDFSRPLKKRKIEQILNEKQKHTSCGNIANASKLTLCISPEQKKAHFTDFFYEVSAFLSIQKEYNDLVYLKR